LSFNVLGKWREEEEEEKIVIYPEEIIKLLRWDFGCPHTHTHTQLFNEPFFLFIALPISQLASLTKPFSLVLSY